MPERRIAVTASVNQWDLGDQGTSERPSHLAGRLMLGILSAWVEGADPRPSRGSAAARSYVAGLIVGDRLTSRLGISTALAASNVDAVVDTSIVAEGTPWDPEAFGAAVLDVAATDGTLPALLKLARQRTQSHHLALVQRQLGVPFLGSMVTDK